MNSFFRLPLLARPWAASFVLIAGFLAGCENLATHQPLEPQLGLQAYTFRAFSFTEALEKAEKLGIHYLQAYPGQRLEPGSAQKFDHNLDSATQARLLALAKSRHVSIVSYGVVQAKNEQEWRQIFGFARAMGLRDIAAEPTAEAMPLVDRLAQESGVKVSLHNHATPSIYADPDVALAAIRPYGSHFGLCADTGHWVRSGFDPVTSLRKAEGRIISLHFKDLTARSLPRAHDVPWGTGVSDAAGQIAELRRQNFGGVVFVEYEYQSPELETEVARSVEYFRRAMSEPRSAAVSSAP